MDNFKETGSDLIKNNLNEKENYLYTGKRHPIYVYIYTYDNNNTIAITGVSVNIRTYVRDLKLNYLLFWTQLNSHSAIYSWCVNSMIYEVRMHYR